MKTERNAHTILKPVRYFLPTATGAGAAPAVAVAVAVGAGGGAAADAGDAGGLNGS